MGEVAIYRRGSFPQPYGKSEWYDGEEAKPFVQVADVTDAMNLVDDTKQKISKLAQPMSVFAEKGSVLVTLQGSIGRVAITQYGAFVDRTVLIFEKYKTEIDNLFWAYVIKQKFIEEAYKAPGGTIKTITKEALSDFDLLLPNFNEQKQIGKYFSNLDNLITLHQRKYNLCNKVKVYAWEQRKFGELVDKYEDSVETPTDGYMRLGIRSHAKGTFYSYVEKGKELEVAKMFRVAANNFIVNITFGWEHAVAITDENDAGKLVSHRFPQYQFNKGMIPKFFRYLILDESFKHHLELSSPGGAGRNRVLKLSDMLDYHMRFPSEQEQKKVATYFDTLDNLITLHQRKKKYTKKLIILLKITF